MLLGGILSALIAVTAGCSSLPDVHGLLHDVRLREGSNVVMARGGCPEGSGDVSPLSESMNGRPDVVSENPAIVEMFGGTPLFSGNKATLLIDGDATYAAMFDAMAKAKDHINFETYVIEDDDIGRRFADLLLKKSAEGVAVHLIYDAFGCRRTPRSFFERLKEGGINVAEFNPMALGRLWGPNAFYRRTHRKILIVDGVVAFTGGINVGAAYLKSRPPRDRTSPPTEFWRDTDVMIEGPAVAAFQAIFIRAWLEQRGMEPFPGNYFPPVKDKGNETVQVVNSTPGYWNRGNYVMYVSAVAHARKSAYIIHSYFAPDNQMMKALIDAARRGVDVRVILPEHTDHAIVRQAARRRYQELLDAGVRIYEHSGAVLHSKTAVIDGVWSTVGSTNLELWSLVTSDEANAVVIGREFAADMEDSFRNDLAQSREILVDRWRERPFVDRVKEFVSDLFHYWL